MIAELQKMPPPLNLQRVLVTGGRDFTDGDYVFRQLALLHHRYGFRLLIHGGARGADTLADVWARGAGVHPCKCDALWPYWRSRGFYKMAGTERNAAMLLLQPQLVVAFPGGNGTRDMVQQAKLAEIPVLNLAADYEQECPHE